VVSDAHRTTRRGRSCTGVG